MDIIISSVREYLLAMVAITGQAERKNLGSELPYSVDRLNSMISVAYSEKLLTKYKSETTNKAFLRLSSPNGDIKLKNISIELYYHLILLLGSEDRRYHLSGVARTRLEYNSIVVKQFYDAGCSIDRIRIIFQPKSETRPPAVRKETLRQTKPLHWDTNSVFEKDGTLRSIEDVTSETTLNNMAYFTLKALKLREEKTINSRENMSRSYGLLLSGEFAYMVYYIDETEYKWSINVEDLLRTMYRTSKRLPKTNNIYGPDGLFFVPDVKIYTDVLARKNKRKYICWPLNLFKEHAYMLPMDQPVTNSLIKFMTIENGRRKFLYQAGASENEIGEDYDLLIDDIYWFMFCTADLKVLDNARRYIREGKVVSVMLMDFQKEGAAKYLGLNAADAEKVLTIIDGDQETVITIMEEIFAQEIAEAKEKAATPFFV